MAAAASVIPRRGWVLWPAALLGVAVLAWLAGFAWFVSLTSRQVPPPPDADGIVALTGGAERIEAALRLLAADRGAKLLVSGIGGGLELPVLARRAGLAPGPLADRVTLGRSATSTRGNAVETAAWVRDNEIRSLIVVTAYYHMPRAMAELGRTMPGVTLYPYPVLVPSQTGHAVRFGLLAEEFSKYLLVAAGVSPWLPSREPHPGRSE